MVLGKRMELLTMNNWKDKMSDPRFHDIKKLLEVMQELVDNGNTMIVIEHNLDVIKTADHIIDLGPEGGDKGGYVVAQGTPEEVSKVAESHTGIFLNKLLNK